jgi:cation transport ATPase
LKGGDPMANQTITLPVGGMTCANCAMNIEKGIKKAIKGIQYKCQFCCGAGGNCF